jgi:ribosomal-protein-alanine N-acetyltransferase
VSTLGPDPDSTNVYALNTERLSLDLPRPDEAANLFSLIGGPDRREICATLLWDGPEAIDEIEDWIDRCANATFSESGYHWVIRDREGVVADPGTPLGAIGTRPTGQAGRGDVGYWLGKPYWGNGIMSESLTRLLRFGFEELGYLKMEAEVFTHNSRGTRLVERVGMTHEGTIRRAHLKYGEWVDAAIYGMLPEEAPPR